MLRGAFVSSAIILLTACTVTPNSSTTLFIERLDLKVPALLQEHQEPGIAIAFVDGCMGSLRTYGLANREAAAAVRPNTVFNLGSVSKTFTAWTVMTLVEAGKVKLDDPADTYLSRWHLPESTFDRHAVTVRRLLNHTAGISIPSVSGVDRGTPVPSLIDELNGRGPAKAQVQIVRTPGAGFQYSGGGYGILQLLVEDVTGQPFAEYARQVVFERTGMTSTSFGWTPETVQRAAMPYLGDGSRYRLREFSASGAAGLVSTAEDMSAFLLAHCRGAQAPVNNAALKPETLKQMRTEGVLAPGLGWWNTASRESWVDHLWHRVRGTHGREARYALGYTVVPGPSPEFDIAGHSGSNLGWKAELIMMPAQGLGIAIMTNAGDGRVRNDVRTMFHEEIMSRIRR
jgi:CubicO group peptidase (beta-lactamase class C family)